MLVVEMEMENCSLSLAPEMRHILASLDSVASAADRIQKRLKTKLPPWGFEPRPQLVCPGDLTQQSKLVC